MKYIIGLFFIVVSSFSLAGQNVGPVNVSYLYQLDRNSTEFEFSIGTYHSCGSDWYRVKSPSDVVANRKFDLVLTAFNSSKRVVFYDTETCEDDRRVVGWVRLVN